MMTEEVARVTREQYPEIIQAVRWMDKDNGTPHFEPGIGFIVDDPDGLTVPTRWLPHLATIEAALAGLDHAAPHPLDVDTINWLAREGKKPSLHDSAAYCFVSGEHTPMTAMANSSVELFTAARFLNERFDGWLFDPTSGFQLPASESETIAVGVDFLTSIALAVNELLAAKDRNAHNSCGILDAVQDLVQMLEAAGVDTDATCYPPRSAQDEADDDAMMADLDGQYGGFVELCEEAIAVDPRS